MNSGMEIQHDGVVGGVLISENSVLRAMTYVRTRTKTGKACTVYNGTVIEENRIIANGTTE